MNSPVFFLTDFGLADTYVAQMKAVILSFAGYDTVLVDLTHKVEPGNIMQAAFHLKTALPKLPAGSVTLAVVDPGVGSSRHGIVLQWRGRYVVAPDNGLISMLPEPFTAWLLPPPEPGASATFHGRDFFAPAAAKLLLDPGWTSFLEGLEDPVLLDAPEAVFDGEHLTATVLHVDHFGNCVLNVSPEDVPGFIPEEICAAGAAVQVFPVTSYYQTPGREALLFLRGGHGYYELALNGSSAAERLGLAVGDNISLTGKRGDCI